MDTETLAGTLYQMVAERHGGRPKLLYVCRRMAAAMKTLPANDSRAERLVGIIQQYIDDEGELREDGDLLPIEGATFALEFLWEGAEAADVRFCRWLVLSSG